MNVQRKRALGALAGLLLSVNAWSAPNVKPTVSLTAPTANQVFAAPANVTLSANAADSDGTISKVEFYRGSTLIATDTAAPYSVTWSSAPAGSYSLTAIAYDNKSASTTSTAVAIVVDTLPTVSVTAPANNASFVAPASITVTATAADSDGTVSKVEFYNGATLIGTATASPYSISWSNVAAGNYSLTAKATDNNGVVTTSGAINVTVNANQAPAVSLTAPTANQVFTAPANVTVSANASDSDGSIAKVEFYNGSTLIGTDTTAPYSISWNSVTAGNYSLTAKATDDKGAVTTSSATAIVVDIAPTVSISSPANNASYVAPANITVTASAADSDGTVSKVEFYQGSTLIGTATASPYQITWSNVATGSYTLTAKATDNNGVATTGSAINVTVAANQAPAVSVTAPTANQVFTAPANVTVTANASDSDGSIAKVEFYNGTTLIGTATSSPYSVSWNNVAAGSYNLTAKAYDDKGGTTDSAAVAIVVDAAPTVSISSPANNANFTSPATITLTANASDSDGTVAKVEFYSGSNLIGTVTSSPYSLTWSSVMAGSYTVTAKAYDDQGAVTTSTAISLTVTASGTQVTYLWPDQLGTPRLASDEAGRTVWRNAPTAEPFGAGTVEEDPDGDGNRFELNLRFPGQYQNNETGLTYNYFRDYDPNTGRYVQSDPIGLGGGQWSTYTYVGNDPISAVDPDGLIKWKGEMYAATAAAGLGGGQYWFDLKSECVNGKYAYIRIYASALVFGVGAKAVPLGGGGSSVSFDDGLSSLAPEGFQGDFKISSAGAGVILTGGYSLIKLGNNFADVSATPSPGVGVDASIGSGIGRSMLTSVTYKNCDCGVK